MWRPFKNFIINSKDRNRSSIIWNAFASTLNAGQAAILLIFISHNLGHSVAGMVTIAYAIANLLMTVCNYGIRTYQVTDIKENYKFSDYFYSRCFTILICFILLIAYIFYDHFFFGYSIPKSVIIIEITVLKLIDAYEDVHIGRYQQIGRLDAGAKIMSLRILFSTALICILISIGSEIYYALFGGIVLSVILEIYFLKNTFFIADAKPSNIQINKVFSLLKQCLPLCIGMTLSVFVGNAPKYMIDTYMSEEAQATFGYIMMPAFLITLLSQFIYQPLVKNLGDLWNSNNRNSFKKNICKQCLTVIGIMFITILGGLIWGLPFLSVIYNIDLSLYQTEFVILLFGGGLFALAYYLNVPITIIRKQTYIAYGYAIIALFSLLSGKYFVGQFGMMGAALLYLFINVILVIIYSLVLKIEIKEKVRNTPDYNKK